MSSKELFIEPYRPDASIKILLFVLIITGIAIVLSKRENIINNWSDKDVRCNPIIMATAPLYNKNIIKNSKDCLNDYFKNELQGELSNLKNKVSNMNQLHSNTNDNMNKMNTQHIATTGLLTGLLKNVNAIFANLIVNLKKDAIKGKSMMQKFGGVVTSLLYILQGAGDSGTSFMNGPIYKILSKLGKGFCFSKNVKIKLENGEFKKIYKLKLNDVLENGSVVNGVIKLNNVYKEPFYTFKHNKNILVTETHLVFDEQNNKFIQTKNHHHAILTDKVEDRLYCLVTSDHLIKIGHYTFWDYDD